MVSIGIQRNSENQVIGCHLSGHAGYDEHGFDIVCAAVSALTATAMLGLTQIAKQEGEYTNSEGRCDIVLSGTTVSYTHLSIWRARLLVVWQVLRISVKFLMRIGI